MAKKKITKKKLTPLKYGAIAVIGVGAGWLLWSKVLKRYFIKENEDINTEVEEVEEIQQAPPQNTINNSISTGNAISLGVIKNIDNQSSKLDIDKKIRKGDKNNLVYKIQIAVNNIARNRGVNKYYDKDKNLTINFPISTDSNFGNMTDSALKFALPDYKGAGFTTVRKAREQWVRSAGFYQKPFPTDLSAVSNYADLKKIYDINRAKGAVQNAQF